MYLEESLEHLADIENDLLSIEADGAAINEDLVNKVYRAAHSIKGGAGFMGLINIEDLTHGMENILGKIRSREMVPTSGTINALLKASDALKVKMHPFPALPGQPQNRQLPKPRPGFQINRRQQNQPV